MQAGELTKPVGSRKQRKEKKNKMKKVTGINKTKLMKGQAIKKRKRAEK